MRSWIREWTGTPAAAGFAAECARLALSFYRGERKSDLVAAITVAEKYAAGEQITAAHAAAHAAARASAVARAVRAADKNPAYRPSYAAACAAIYAADIVNYADAAGPAAADCADYANYAATRASRAGVDDSEIDIAYARWVVRDLSQRWPIDEEIRLAAGAAIVAGDELLAKEILR